jgi:hypothetical protein
VSNLSTLCLIACVALFPLSCAKSTEPAPVAFVAYQVSGCNQTPAKSSHSDSCLSYRFHDALLVDFCASGNCCPDSQRFMIHNEIHHDTIVVTIADTAAQLCRCNCRYVLHVEVEDLPLPSYLFVCRRQDYSSQFILYSERVFRR